MILLYFRLIPANRLLLMNCMFLMLLAFFFAHSSAYGFMSVAVTCFACFAAWMAIMPVPVPISNMVSLGFMFRYSSESMSRNVSSDGSYTCLQVDIFVPLCSICMVVFCLESI